ncbi:MAG: integrase, partial [Xanthomonadales bacterium]|nr:integrase [Xanthomonadales bacterium]
MLNAVNSLDRLAVGRLQEFLSERVPWHRSLWGVGVILAMDELGEACVAKRAGHLSEAAVQRMASTLQTRVGQHPAFAETEKKFLQQQLKSVPRADGVAHLGLQELSGRVASDYLSRWSRAVAAGHFHV